MPSLSGLGEIKWFSPVHGFWRGREMNEREKCTLDFGLDIVDGVRGFDLEGNGFAREGLDEDLHRGLTAERVDQYI